MNPSAITPLLAAKRDRLLAIIAEFDGVAVAFSGGIDSTVVAKAAAIALGPRAIAVTADSASVPRAEIVTAREIAKLIGIHHIVVPTQEFDNPDYLKNDGTRCYHCKSELYSRVAQLLPELGIAVVASGANLDDRGDYRPGLLAASERGIRHPLQEAGFSKADVRAVAQYWELPTWDKPAAPCLSSRLAPGLAVTPERTKRIEDAESFLHSLGLVECRVRYHEGDLARLEVPLAEVARIAAAPTREQIGNEFHRLGFKFVTLDLDGFRSGSLNELVPLELKAKFRSA